jgi:hypothetical protein
MKTAGRENPDPWTIVPRSRAHGAEGQNRSCSTRWAAKVEKFHPREKFFLTFPLLEQSGKLELLFPACQHLRPPTVNSDSYPRRSNRYHSPYECVHVWTEPFVELRAPLIANLRSDPLERGEYEGIDYAHWFVDHIFVLAPPATCVVPDSALVLMPVSIDSWRWLECRIVYAR